MKKQTIISILIGFVLTFATTAVANPIPLGFDNGESSAYVDAYPGTTGSGWDSAWYDFGGTKAVTVQTADPLSTGTGPYLNVTSTGSYHTIARQYGNTATFNTLSAHTISWDFRLENEIVFDDLGDRINFYGDSAADESSDDSVSWLIGVAPLRMGSSNWYMYDYYDGGFTSDNVVVTPIPIAADTTYSFSVTLHPATATYDATVSNGQLSYTRTGLGYRNNTIMSDTPWLHFGTTSNNTPSIHSYSIDSIEVTGGAPVVEAPEADGFQGFWYAIEKTDEYGTYYKYSGGLGTYPQQIHPMAIYREETDKTFFVYGGTNEDNSTLYSCISYYDHVTGQVARPRIVKDVQSTNAHHNPCMAMDEDGYIFVFSNGNHIYQPSFINRSTDPYSIDSFEQVLELPGENNFTYGQPYYIEGQGFLFLYTHRNANGRALCYNTSSDGITWDQSWENKPEIAMVPTGEYQISRQSGQKVGTAFNNHPGDVVDARTNLFYMETTDFAQTWTTADGTVLTTPVTSVTTPALVHDYESEGLLVYLKNLEYDADDQPVIMYMTSPTAKPYETGTRQFHIAHFDEGNWVIKDLFTVDHNYDFGQLEIEDDGTWRIIAPTIDGPQTDATGGEMAMWISEDEGDTWAMIRQLTYDSVYNHMYAKMPIDAHDDFYAFWADGNADAPSESCLYFTDKDGTGVWKLPYDMTGDFATPELAYTPKYIGIPGDANQDGKVDASDATILAGNWQAWPATWEMGDFNGDGKVNASDATILAGNWQYDATAGSVPEPSAWALFLGLLLMLGCKWRKMA
ncbi:MAG: BNR-4 repeat-containing protein [Planctomycetia bacterium]|jgi:hypothetical protein